MGPNVGAVIVHEDGDVADDANLPLRAISVQRLPLLEECKLKRALHGDLLFQLLPYLIQRFGATLRDGTRPFIPTLKLESFAQAAEKNKIFQPPGVVATKALEAVAFAQRVG